MNIVNKSIFLYKKNVIKDGKFSINELKNSVLSKLKKNETPIRFIITKSDTSGYYCEVDILTSSDYNHDIFFYSPRTTEDISEFNIALIIPTGIGCEIGGHAGDANVVAKMLASICDNLITHPNVVNAANYNESSENTLYVEGSVLTQLFIGQIGLQKVRKNKIILFVDQHESKFFNDELINAASTARITLGIECEARIMPKKILSDFTWSAAGRASGIINNLDFIFDEISNHKCDAIALSTGISMPDENYDKYFKNNEYKVNLWGGIEAMLTHAVSQRFSLPCAHAPLMNTAIWEKEFGIVDPRKSAESNSLADIHCVLKGLHRSPRIVNKSDGINNKHISCLIIPDRCVGLPTLTAFDQGIPVIVVKENENIMENNFDDFPFDNKNLYIVNNYWEAIGVARCLKEGIDPFILRRPVDYTKVL